MGRITINGVTIDVGGFSSIRVSNGDINVDGNVIKVDTSSGRLDIKLEGTVSSVNADGSVQITGDATGDITCGGSFTGKNVGGNVDCGGSFTGDNVGGSIDAGGSVHISK